jgi:hypothetical protein
VSSSRHSKDRSTLATVRLQAQRELHLQAPWQIHAGSDGNADPTPAQRHSLGHVILSAAIGVVSFDDGFTFMSILSNAVAPMIAAAIVTSDIIACRCQILLGYSHSPFIVELGSNSQAGDPSRCSASKVPALKPCGPTGRQRI